MTINGDKKGPEEKTKYGPGSILRVESEHGYEVVRPIAAGGMGSVLEARDLRCERSVAVKLALPAEGGDADTVARFVKEAMITSQLQHPNIVPIHEVDTDSHGNRFYVMKLIKGTTLSDILVRLRRHETDAVSEFPLSKLLAIFLKVCDAVAFAHSSGYVHRDLNPNNVMIGDFGEVMVLDWGLASRMGESGEDAAARDSADAVHESDHVENQHPPSEHGQTEAGVIMGTPSYMAPEQIIREMARISPQTDIYALGGILYSILALRPPVVGSNSTEIFKKIMAGDLVSPTEHDLPSASVAEDAKGARPVGPSAHCPDGAVPQMLADIAMKALSHEPAKRYRSVRSLQEEVEAFQGGLAWNLVVDEDFHDGTFSERWEIVSGDFELAEGELCLGGGEPQLLVLKQDVPGDIRIDVECHEDSPYLNEIGCVIGGVRSEDAWDMSVSGYACKLGAYNNNFNVLTRLNTKIWDEEASPLTVRNSLRVRFEKVGSRLRMLSDGQEVFSVIDPNPLAGSQRTMVGLLGWVAETRYTRIRVYTLGLPWESDILDIAERQMEKGRYSTATDLFRETLDAMPDEDRRARAEAGLNKATALASFEVRLPEWQRRLEKAWPHIRVDLRIDTQGLSVSIPPGSGIHDLSPLKGLPVAVLQCAKNRITDLKSLRGAPLVSLDCTENTIQNLSPLTGMPLHTLLCSHCQIENLEPLGGMPLTRLNIAFNPLRVGLESLRGMPLEWISCDRSGITTLEPLRGMRLAMLFCDGNSIEDLEPLQDMPIDELSCAGNRIRSVDMLRGTSLKILHCHCNEIEDLEPLGGLGLTILTCHDNRIRDLSPIYNMPLNLLICANNPVHHLGGLLEHPPHIFFYDVDQIETEDIERMQTLWSRDSRFGAHSRYLSVLLAMRRQDSAELRQLGSEFRGHRYLFIPKFLSWDNACKLAEELGGHLATITSLEENEFICSLFPAWMVGAWGWIGLRTEESGPQWITSEPFGFSAFRVELDATILGPKVFCAGKWSYDVLPNASNAMFMEWDS